LNFIEGSFVEITFNRRRKYSFKYKIVPLCFIHYIAMQKGLLGLDSLDFSYINSSVKIVGKEKYKQQML
jgi:hypothetical protein